MCVIKLTLSIIRLSKRLLLKRYKIELINGGSSIVIKSKSIALFIYKKGYIGLFSLHSFIYSLDK